MPKSPAPEAEQARRGPIPVRAKGPVIRLMSNRDHHRVGPRLDIGTAQSSPFASGQGHRRVDIDAAQATYYESGGLASATRVRRTEWLYDHRLAAPRGDWVARIARWIVDFWWVNLGVATTAGGVWGASVLFGWRGTIATLFLLCVILTSASDTA